MQPFRRLNKALLLKCYDSATDGRARFTPHTAFDDPTAPDDAAPRESIEVRTLSSYAPSCTRRIHDDSEPVRVSIENFVYQKLG